MEETEREGWPGGIPAAKLLGAARHLLMEGGPPMGPWGGHKHHRAAHVRPAGFPGPPFAWGWAGPPPRGRSRRSRRGDVRLAVLRLLAERPMHGYQIITELVERSGGAWQPSPGSIYPTLQQLADEGLVTVDEADGRRTFALTDAGRAELDAIPADRRAPWEEMADEAEDGSGALREHAGQLMAAVMQVASAGSERQVARAEALLRDCRRALYRLLAEDEEEQS